MTVDELRKALEGVPGDTVVLVPDDMARRGYSTPTQVTIPDPNGEYRDLGSMVVMIN